MIYSNKKMTPVQALAAERRAKVAALYPTMANREIAAALGITVQRVAADAMRLQLTKPYRAKPVAKPRNPTESNA